MNETTRTENVEGQATDGATPPEATADEFRGKTFPCESCGADLEFHIGVQNLRCKFCGFVKQIDVPEQEIHEQDLGAMLAKLAEFREEKLRKGGDGAHSEEADFREVDCHGCGATIRFQGTLTSSECTYCGSPLQVDKVHDATRRVPVDAVLPFKVDRKKARGFLKKWVGSLWFAPNAFRRRGIEGKLDGTYLPYWTYDSMTDTAYTGMRGQHYYVTVGSGKNRRRVRKTRWYPASGRFQRFFDDVLVVAAQGIPKKKIDKLSPWPLEDCKSFSASMLAGFLARTYDVELADGLTEAKDKMKQALRSDVKSRIGGDTQRITSMKTGHSAMTYKHLLLPVWMMAYRYHDKVFQVVINACTGEVQGDRPWSWLKIALAVAAGLGVIGVILLIRAMSG